MTRTPGTRWIDDDGQEIDEDHRGLVYDIRTLVDRRRALGIFGGIAATALLAACAPDGERRDGVADGERGCGIHARPPRRRPPRPRRTPPRP